MDCDTCDCLAKYPKIVIDPNENLEKKFIRRGKWLYFFTFFFGPVSYAVKIILSGTLSVEEI